MANNLCDSIGVIGMGVVGRAVARGWLEWCGEVRCYDVLPDRATHSLVDTIESNVVFICLPTPSALDGSCCMDAIEFGLFENIQGCLARLVLRSTVSPGTTREYSKRYDLPSLIHSPEFLTARCAQQDFNVPARNLIGGLDNEEPVLFLKRLYEQRFPGIPCYVYSAEETELIKLATNAFFATKVSFFNELRQISDWAYYNKSGMLVNNGCDWNHVLEGILSDGRIAHSHTQVPGPDGEWGFGGDCLPKDLLNLIDVAKERGVTPNVLQGAHDKNVSVRGHKDQDGWVS